MPAGAPLPTGPWNAWPAFLSSTFFDTHAGRDYLRTRIFQRLEEKLLERRHLLEPIYLRLVLDAGSLGE